MRWRPKLNWSVRTRLTVLYGALFVISGAALLAITYGLVTHSGARLLVAVWNGTGRPPSPETLAGPLRERAEQQHAAAMRQLLIESGVALGLMVGVSAALGWLMAGRALRPVRTMVGRTRRISERNLHERLAVAGPDDELKKLADTIDGLLARLERAFESQRRFVASASHELRTPLTLQRATIEVALADPHADAASLREVCERVLAAGDEQERLIEALLTLAASERGLDRRAHVDLALVVAGVLRTRRDAGTPQVTSDLGAGWVSGDARLVERLAANLIDNATRYNRPDGWVQVRTGTVDGLPALRVANSGPPVPPDQVAALFRPFERMPERTGDQDGHGLGLSIVAAIAMAHGAQIAATARAEGGLDVTVRFPSPRPETPAAPDRTGLPAAQAR